jgi:hypothetical protein
VAKRVLRGAVVVTIVCEAAGFASSSQQQQQQQQRRIDPNGSQATVDGITIVANNNSSVSLDDVPDGSQTTARRNVYTVRNDNNSVTLEDVPDCSRTTVRGPVVLMFSTITW